MIRNFTRAEVLEAFIETVHEGGPFFLADKCTKTRLSLPMHDVIEETIKKVIKKASPDLNLTVLVDSIQHCSYQGANLYEPYFSTDPSDVHFYVSREASPSYFNLNGGETLTNTVINIDYYYPGIWAMTPPRDEEMSIRRTMDEILFAWTIVVKTLTCTPIVLFDDEEEATEATFAFANAYLFKKVMEHTNYYKVGFNRRLFYIQEALKGKQPAIDKRLGIVMYPPNKKIGQLEIPVVNILRNRLTQYNESYLSCNGNNTYEEFLEVIKAFTLCHYKEKSIPEEDISHYLLNCVGKAPKEYRDYNMSHIRRLTTSDDYRATRPPMISAIFKGIGFYDVCPFTYRGKDLTYIHFEKDIVSHLEKTFKHLDIEAAIEAARNMEFPEPNEVNDGYDADPDSVIPGLFQFSLVAETQEAKEKLNEKYKNQGLYMSEHQDEIRGDILDIPF